MDCSPPGSSVPGIPQARILEWLPFPPPGDLPDPGIIPAFPALTGGFVTTSECQVGSYINLLKIIKLFTQNDKSYGMLTVAQQH